MDFAWGRGSTEGEPQVENETEEETKRAGLLLLHLLLDLIVRSCMIVLLSTQILTFELDCYLFEAVISL